MIGRRGLGMMLRGLACEGRRRCHKHHDHDHDQRSHFNPHFTRRFSAVCSVFNDVEGNLGVFGQAVETRLLNSLICTNTSLPPPCGEIKPQPSVRLNHLKGQLGTLDRCDIIAANLRRQAHAARVRGGRWSRHGGTYFGGRSSPTSHAVIDGSSSGSIRSHSQQRSAPGPVPSTGITRTIKPPQCLHRSDEWD
jgi:hypothetical protein